MVCAVGEVYDSSDATPITPTRTRRDGETIVHLLYKRPTLIAIASYGAIIDGHNNTLALCHRGRSRS